MHCQTPTGLFSIREAEKRGSWMVVASCSHHRKQTCFGHSAWRVLAIHRMCNGRMLSFYGFPGTLIRHITQPVMSNQGLDTDWDSILPDIGQQCGEVEAGPDQRAVGHDLQIVARDRPAELMIPSVRPSIWATFIPAPRRRTADQHCFSCSKNER